MKSHWNWAAAGVLSGFAFRATLITIALPLYAEAISDGRDREAKFWGFVVLG
ncbi:MAG: hypothetical protein ACRDQZ_25720 [Mycobacteriales bacterium]